MFFQYILQCKIILLPSKIKKKISLLRGCFFLFNSWKTNKKQVFHWLQKNWNMCPRLFRSFYDSFYVNFMTTKGNLIFKCRLINFKKFKSYWPLRHLPMVEIEFSLCRLMRRRVLFLLVGRMSTTVR